MEKKFIFGSLGGMFLLFCLVTAMLGCRSVPSGYVGVQSRWGAVFSTELQPGVHIIVPYVDGLVLVDTRLRSFDVVAEDAPSFDSQQIDTTVSLQHSINPAMAAEVYSKIGNLDEIDKVVISKAVHESVREITAKYTTEKLVTKRAEVKAALEQAILREITKSLDGHDLHESVHITNVAITNFAFSKEYNASIEAKVKAEQEALKAKNEKEKRITEAEAAAREQTLAAEAKATAIELESKSRADAIKREADALNNSENLIKLRLSEKWNGILPQYLLQNAMPILDIK